MAPWRERIVIWVLIIELLGFALSLTAFQCEFERQPKLILLVALGWFPILVFAIGATAVDAVTRH
jgi:hypothetical protein